jgi:hypothetical protein
MKKIGIAIASIATTALLGLSAGASFAATANSDFSARYAAMDLNGDGAVSVTEFGQAAQKYLDAQKANGFASLDVNGDGTITPAELLHPAAFVTKEAAPTMSKADYTVSDSGARDVSKLRPVIEVYEIIDSPTK